MAKPIAVLISDVHFTPASLPLATAAMTQAIRCAESLNIPLVDCGDLMDTKAIIRAEVANELIRLFSQTTARIILLVGNHTLVNEKGKEHAMNFLRPYAQVVDAPVYDEALNTHLLPYHSNSQELQAVLDRIPNGSRIVMHQGVQTAHMGHYIQDKSSLPKESYADFRVLTGHYHRKQDIKCGRPRKGAVGLLSYIGSPYTQSFGEANDGPKGFQVLHDDGSLQFVPTNLRKHIIMEGDADLTRFPLSSSAREVTKDDLVWLKIKDTPSRLAKVDKKAWGMKLLGHTNYKLDLIPVESEAVLTPAEVVPPQTDGEILDTLIDRMPETPEQRRALKALWREVLNES